MTQAFEHPVDQGEDRRRRAEVALDRQVEELSVDGPRLAKGLERLLADPKLRQEMGAMARARVVERFPISVMRDRTLEIFYEAGRARGRGWASAKP